MLNKFKSQLHRFWSVSFSSSITLRRARLEELQNQKKQADSKNLSGHGYKVFSQSDEDGIIAAIFERIGLKNKVFVEFGVGDGLENNTLALLCDGWRGLWLEGSKDCCNKISKGLSNFVSSGNLVVQNHFITRENIDILISESIPSGEVDLLSIDIDSNDAHILEAIKSITARVIVMEYNSKFGPSINYRMAYDETYVWKKTDQYGSSLKNLELTLRKKGYSCVGCNVVGTNAFFVRDDLLENKFSAPYTSEHHFEPARFELVGLPSGHRATYNTLNNMSIT